MPTTVVLLTFYFVAFAVFRFSNRLVAAQGEFLVWNPTGTRKLEIERGSPIIVSFFHPAWILEHLLFTKRGPEVTYVGEYTEALALEDLTPFVGGFPAEASGFRGEYKCAYWDDYIEQRIEFDLPQDAWNRWLPTLKIEIQKRVLVSYGDLEEKIDDSKHSLNADSGPSSGTLRIVYDNTSETVQVQRFVQD